MLSRNKREISKTRPTIGLLLTHLFNEYNINIWSSIIRQADEKDVNLICFVVGILKEKYDSQIYDLIEKRNIDGMIAISGCLCEKAGDEELKKLFERYSDIPIVSIGIPLKGIPSIVPDNKKGMKDVIVHLIEKHGLKRLAFFRGHETNMEAEERYAAYKEVLQQYKIPFNPDLVFLGDFYVHSAVKGVATLIDERKAVFDAIICANDVMAIGAIKELNRRGIKVPDDIIVTGFDDSDEGRSIKPSLTTVNQSLSGLGKKAFSMILDKIKNKKVPDKVVFSTQLLIRRSCGCSQYEDIQKKKLLKAASNKIYKFKKPQLAKHIASLIKQEIEMYYPAFNDFSKLSEWSLNLYNSIFDDIKNNSEEKFLYVLENTIIEASNKGIETAFWNKIVSLLMNNLSVYIKKSDKIDFIKNIWVKSLEIILNIVESQKTGSEITNRNQDYELYALSHELISIFEMDKLKDLVIQKFPKLGINSCYIFIYIYNKNKSGAKILVGYDQNKKIIIKEETEISSNMIIPNYIKKNQTRNSYIIMPLVFENVKIGFVIYEINPNLGTIHETLSTQLSSALRGIEIMKKIRKYSDDLMLKVKERTMELEEANKKLQKLDALKNDFIANITHDFRSPLTVILNLSDLALRSTTSLFKDEFNLIYTSSLKLKESIDRLLELVKLEAQGIVLNIKKIDVVRFLDSINNFYKSALMNSNIRVIKNYSLEEIDNFYTDEERLEEVINNIISNAIKFVDPEKGVISIGLKNSKHSIVITISDNGIGIPKDKLDLIFNRFEQLDTGKSKYGGTGIGLAFAKQLIENMKGEIWAESEGIDKGSTFFIKLKKGTNHFDSETVERIKQINENDIDRENITHKSNEYSVIKFNIEKKMQLDQVKYFINNLNKENEFDYKKALILIIDDDIDITKIVMNYLQLNGYINFIISNSGKMGLEAIYKNQPDIIICDYNMAEMSGDKVHDEVLNNPKFKNTPFVFLSAIADQSLIVERREKGANAYLKKPIEEKDLILTIEFHLKKYFEYSKTLQLASIDELTGVYNRRELLKRLEEDLAVRKYRNLSLMIIDIDFFKEYNDLYGHQAGDLVLKNFGSILKSNLREYDIPGRYGGDEFIIILSDIDLKDTLTVAETIRSEVEKTTIIYNDKQIKITCSIGIATLIENEKYIVKQLNISELRNVFEIKSHSAEEWDENKKTRIKISEILMLMADNALYKAKSTVCKNCSYSSEKIGNFKGGCPKCHSHDLIMGRNKIYSFDL